MARLWADILVLWLAAIVFAFAAFMAHGLSIHENRWEERIGCALPLIILLVALVVTLLQLVGIIGVW